MIWNPLAGNDLRGYCWRTNPTRRRDSPAVPRKEVDAKLSSKSRCRDTLVLLTSGCEPSDVRLARGSCLSIAPSHRIFEHTSPPADGDEHTLTEATGFVIPLSAEASSRIAAYEWIKYLRERNEFGTFSLVCVGEDRSGANQSAERVIAAARRFLGCEVVRWPRVSDSPQTMLASTRLRRPAQPLRHRLRLRIRTVWNALAAVFF